MITMQSYFEQCFPADKLRADLWTFLKEDGPYNNEVRPIEDSVRYIVEAVDEFTSEVEDKILDVTDDITVIWYDCRYEFSIDVYFRVKIAIGEFKPNPVAREFFFVSKCVAIMRYNRRFELYDIEFFVCQGNKNAE